MAKNYDIQTRSEHLAQAASDSIALGLVVPAGMTRYVTFIKVSPMESANDEGSKVFLCSAASVGVATTDALASAAQKMAVYLVAATSGNNKEAMVPPGGPNTEHPLFTVAAGAFLTAHLACAANMSASAMVFVQYYDE